MRYIDSGSRDAEETLGAWLQQALAPDIVELRWQTGFFNAEPLGIFMETLQRLAEDERPVSVLVGSNDPGVLRDDVAQLVHLLALPRSNANFGIVQYANAFYHPKTYHLRRQDGSQCAYVGSANLTGQGVASLHVEAGLLLESREGDPDEVLNKIAASVDNWFTTNRNGMHRVVTPADVDRLVGEQVLTLTPPIRPPAPQTTIPDPNSTGASAARPRLRPLVKLPTVPPGVAPAPPAQTTSPLPSGAGSTAGSRAQPSPIAPAVPTVTRQSFPQHVLFAPNPTGPTSGASALSGRTLPSGALGLIIRLSKDDLRKFTGGPGTANINLPHESISTLRFGVLGRGRFPDRPRAEFDLHARYIAANRTISLSDAAETNVMLYGYLPNETGHQNTRMLLPADIREIGDDVQQAGLPIPSPGDLALLEWPTAAIPDFRLTFMEPGTALAQNVQTTFAAASSARDLVGTGACWLTPGTAPAW